MEKTTTYFLAPTGGSNTMMPYPLQGSTLYGSSNLYIT